MLTFCLQGGRNLPLPKFNHRFHQSTHPLCSRRYGLSVISTKIPHLSGSPIASTGGTSSGSIDTGSDQLQPADADTQLGVPHAAGNAQYTSDRNRTRFVEGSCHQQGNVLSPECPLLRCLTTFMYHYHLLFYLTVIVNCCYYMLFAWYTFKLNTRTNLYSILKPFFLYCFLIRFVCFVNIYLFIAWILLPWYSY